MIKTTVFKSISVIIFLLLYGNISFCVGETPFFLSDVVIGSLQSFAMRDLINASLEKKTSLMQGRLEWQAKQNSNDLIIEQDENKKYICFADEIFSLDNQDVVERSWQFKGEYWNDAQLLRIKNGQAYFVVKNKNIRVVDLSKEGKKALKYERLHKNNIVHDVVVDSNQFIYSVDHRKKKRGTLFIYNKNIKGKKSEKVALDCVPVTFDKNLNDEIIIGSGKGDIVLFNATEDRNRFKFQKIGEQEGIKKVRFFDNKYFGVVSSGNDKFSLWDVSGNKILETENLFLFEFYKLIPSQLKKFLDLISWIEQNCPLREKKTFGKSCDMTKYVSFLEKISKISYCDKKEVEEISKNEAELLSVLPDNISQIFKTYL